MIIFCEKWAFLGKLVFLAKMTKIFEIGRGLKIFQKHFFVKLRKTPLYFLIISKMKH